MRAGLVSFVGASGLLLVVACSAPYAEQGTASEDMSAERAAPEADPTESDAAPETVPKPIPPVPGSSSGGAGTSGGGGSSGGNGDAPDAGADAAAVDPAHCPGKAAPTAAVWKAPPAVSSACTASDITYFAGAAANQTWLGIESLMTKRHAACSKCIFSKETDASWHPVVYVGAEGDAIVNYASCFARAPGGKEACGRAVYQWSDCYAKVCDATACGTQAALDACYGRPDVYDACVAYEPTAACGGATTYASLDNICYSYVDVSRVLCAAGD